MAETAAPGAYQAEVPKSLVNVAPPTLVSSLTCSNRSFEINSETFYFAQPTANGFQVVDNEPKVIMKLYTTSQKNVFLGTKGVINGVLISKENQWFFEYYEGDKLVSESWNLKF